MREVIRAITHPVRASMLQEVSEGPRTVTELSRRLGVSPARVRYHAARLERLRMVDIDRRTRPLTCRQGAAVGTLSGPTMKVVTITARDGATISLPLDSLTRR